jgi:RimJ/RimL family protein N-acetyltransferase
MSHSEIELSMYSDKYLDSLIDYKLPPEQYQFTSYPIEVLNQSSFDHDQFPVLILYEGQAVGFFCLRRGKRVSEITANHSALLLTSFSINYRFQKKGYAKQALSLLANFIKNHFSEMEEVILVVNMKNIPAQTLYKVSGFQDHGGRRLGKKGEQMVLHLEI